MSVEDRSCCVLFRGDYSTTVVLRRARLAIRFLERRTDCTGSALEKGRIPQVGTHQGNAIKDPWVGQVTT